MNILDTLYPHIDQQGTSDPEPDTTRVRMTLHTVKASSETSCYCCIWPIPAHEVYYLVETPGGYRRVHRDCLGKLKWEVLDG